MGVITPGRAGKDNLPDGSRGRIICIPISAAASRFLAGVCVCVC